MPATWRQNGNTNNDKPELACINRIIRGIPGQAKVKLIIHARSVKQALNYELKLELANWLSHLDA